MDEVKTHGCNDCSRKGCRDRIPDAWCNEYKAKTSRDCDYKGVCVVDACFHTKYDNDPNKPMSCSKLVKLGECPCGIKVV